MSLEQEEKSKKYSRTKIILSLINTSFTLLFLIILVFFGISIKISEIASSVSGNDYLNFLSFIAILGIVESIITFPINFYSEFILEHKYNLSNQKFFLWLWEGIKSFLVGLPVIVPILLAFLFLLKNYPQIWWFWIGVVLFFFSVVLARIAPVLIFPLFYKFIPLENESLKNRLVNICNKTGVKVTGIFSFNMSKDTKKANAGFTGIGKSKRIIIGDTLLDKFSEEEIEIVFAHELGHYKYGHIWKGIILSTFTTFTGLFCVSELYKYLLPLFGFLRIDDFAAFPLIGLLMFLFMIIIMPITNSISRHNETRADEYSVDITNNPNAFSSAMLKLSEQNLSDKKPNPVVEFLFYSHPSIEKRIKNIELKYGNIVS